MGPSKSLLKEIDRVFSTTIRAFGALAFLPVGEVENAFDKLIKQEDVPDKFLDFFESYGHYHKLSENQAFLRICHNDNIGRQLFCRPFFALFLSFTQLTTKINGDCHLKKIYLPESTWYI